MTATMLDFYQKHHVAPVRQDVRDRDAHFQRRAFLYRSLGLPPIAITGKAVMEIGPGTGENALYTASLKPSKYVLVEPNDTAREALEAALVDTEAEIVAARVEELPQTEAFDVVLCEGLLGLAGRDARELLAALTAQVTLGGVLVITCIDPISQCADVLRRGIAQKYLKKDASLEENVQALIPIFGPHLATLKGMTRSVEDWIVDNILNPASIGPTFSIPDALEALEGRFAVLGCSPRFLIDWRWYKESDTSNQWAIESYWRNCHNLRDYRHVAREREPFENQELMAKCRETRVLVRAVEEGWDHCLAFSETGIDPGWFGRGQQYLSFVRIT